MPNKQAVWQDKKLWALALAETLAWAGLFYVFPASLLRWSDHFGWSIAELSLGFTFALLASALGSIAAGRLIDRGWSRLLMTGSVVTGALLILLLPSVNLIWQFYVVWIFIGITLSGCLYEPCFSYLTKTYKENAKSPIIMVTLFAGFASTISYPVTNLLSNVFGWEIGIYIFSAALCIVTAPLFWFGVSGRDFREEPKVRGEEVESLKISCNERLPLLETIVPVLRNPIFWGLFVTFAAFASNHGMVVSQIFPLLESREVSPNLALLLASCIGPMQVAARLTLFAVESLTGRSMPMVKVAFFSLICLSLSSLTLSFGSTSTALIVGFVILQGGPYGLVSIIKPVVTAEALGTTNFGIVSSMAGMGSVWSFALAPGIAGVIAERWSYDAVLGTTFSIAVIGIIGLLTTLHLRQKTVQCPGIMNSA